ncbi:unnamed protein product [Ranitomeya imitator]|uniref:PiggyBac transposable element-derived protein domain-containing protein n=1 Tax=Ranitomeya imitator TaxID=111125 RepID=A0ABN9L923_9NEOB|nr:unnamed protein product [Ranitomeya imitator]
MDNFFTHDAIAVSGLPIGYTLSGNEQESLMRNDLRLSMKIFKGNQLLRDSLPKMTKKGSWDPPEEANIT